MGREFELKYAAKEDDLLLLQGRFPHLAPISMETVYFDTPTGDFGRLRWTLRRRLENGRSVCTLKTPAGGILRNEWETPCPDIRDAVPALIALGAPEDLTDLAAKGLQPSCGARFTRLAGELEIPGARVELALDRGVLTGGGKELPFAEVEVELKSGSEEAAAEFAKALAGELGLKEEPRSKVARAIALAEESR